ncbi:F0F1 ATP synthase subunit B [Corynebacterium yudongzhengii]|uniref:ATP synthase subunit b n=1 Tax=Corynebacterium yudongzhengii TaxID=2080740 RepID=A0A2U1T9C5_9CORY|nr:F0F1 ATP synthase subunit B [Corynebacterium yudongzhengii]AWB82102.1 F0F1 ATP synthase subunit B [Corynebacterium yudongzhengii]PWC02606.1 F0F1 ATP synthase subunit B [Corynebacterium yudongzhengii]
MTNVIYLLAQEAEQLPLEGGNSILLPKTYDIVWSIIPFLVILFIFWKFILPKFQEVLTEREDRIKGGIQRAEAAQAEAKAALEKYNAQLAEARSEAAEIREQARERGKEIEAELRANAEAESKRIVENGEKQLQASRDRVVGELRSEMGQNSINLAERLLGTELSDSTKRSGTIDNFLSGLDTVTPAGK